MAAPRTFLSSLCSLFLLLYSSCGSRRSSPPDRCGFKVQTDGSRRPAVAFRTDNCSLNSPLGKHVIHEVSNVSFSHLSCDDQAAVLVHWSASPLGIEHVRGFRVYLEDKNPEGKKCQHLLLKEPRTLNYTYRSTKMSSQPFAGLTFDTDYMVRVVPFPSLMNESFFPPSFLRTNSCEVLLGFDNLVCKPYWKPRTLNVSQLGSNLHVSFEAAPASFGFHFYFLFYKLRQDGPFRTQRCRQDLNQPRTTCILQNVTPGTYTIELRDDGNTTRRQTQYHVSQVHSPWAGPIRAMAITVPLVVMSAFATLFTVMCRKKQQENIYSQLDEESSESSNQSAALSAERPWPRPKVFLIYSNRDGAKHTSVIQSFAFFLQDFCCCEVVLDLWEHLEVCKEGQISWFSRQLDEASFIIIVCSKGLRYYVEKKSRRGKTPVGRRGNSGSSSSPAGGDLFVVGVAMIAEKLRLAKQSEGGGASELSRYMTVYFDYSAESDIPTMLSVAPRFKLMDQLPQLFALLHSSSSSSSSCSSSSSSSPLSDPPLNVSRRNYFRSRSGRSLYVSICNMHQHISHTPDWFTRTLAPPSSSSSSSSSKPPPLPSAPTPPPKPPPSSSGLVLNEVVVRTPSMGGAEGTSGRNELLLASGSRSSPGLCPSPGPSPGLCPSPGPSPGVCPSPGPSPGVCPSSTPGVSSSPDLFPGSSPGVCPSPGPSSPGPGSGPGLPHCTMSRLEPSSRSASGVSALSPEDSSSSAPSILQDDFLVQAEEGRPHAAEAPPPRDSGIYDSSVPSSELSIPLMEGLSHDQADSSSLADSESSSSGLGDEEPPVVSALHCSSSTVCKAELHHHHHHHHHLEHGDALTPVASS